MAAAVAAATAPMKIHIQTALPRTPDQTPQHSIAERTKHNTLCLTHIRLYVDL